MIAIGYESILNIHINKDTRMNVTNTMEITKGALEES